MKLTNLLTFLSIFLATAALFAFSTPKDTYAAESCVFSPKSITAGNSIGIITNDLPYAHKVYIQTYGGPYIEIGTIFNSSSMGLGGGSVTVPTSATAPAYQVSVDSSFGAKLTCADPSGTIGGNLLVTSGGGGGVGCVFSPNEIQAGLQIGIITNGLSPGTHAAKLYTYSAAPPILIGNVPNGGGAVTIPLTTPPTAYQVRVDTGFGGDITCADPSGTIGGNLIVTSAPGGGSCATADLNGDGVVNDFDTQMIVDRVGTRVGDPRYSPQFDWDGNGFITLSDVARHAICISATSGSPGGTVECSNFINCVSGFVKPRDYEPATFVGSFVSKFLPAAIAFGGFMSVIIIVISAIQFITSSGNPDAAAAARGRLTFALVGFVLLVLAFIITRVVDQVFLRGSGVF